MARLFEIRLHEQPIGTLRESDTGFTEFRHTDAYLRRAPPRPVLGQKFIDAPDKPYVGKRRELPPFFANLVPEGELRPFLERRLPIEVGDDLGLLELVGHDLPGAVEVVRIDRASEEPTRAMTGGVGPREFAEADEELRFSLSGVQLKFSVVRAKDKITFPASGGRGDWIVKLDSTRFPGLVENEYSVLEWARLAGFEVPECDLMPTDALRGSLVKYAEPRVFALMIRRYDRLDGVRVHQEDFAQVLNARPQDKYANVSYEAMAALIARLIRDDGSTGIDEFIRRLVFVVASGNSDAHLKNWSLVYPDRVNPKLAPLYDQVATVAWPEVMKKVALKLAGARQFADIDRATFTRFADKAKLDRQRVLKLVDETLERLESAWDIARQTGFWKMLPAQTQALREHWSRTPLLAESPLNKQ